MKTIRTADPQARDQLDQLRASLGLDQGLVADWQKTIADAKSPQEMVDEVLYAVRTEGDAAVSRYTEEFDGAKLSADQFRVSQSDIEAAVRASPPEIIEAMKRAIENIRRYQSATLARDPDDVVDGGRRLGMTYRTLRRVGVCVPGGATAYPSSVLMAAVPAQVAGCKEIALVSPPRENGQIRAPILAACGVAGIREVYRIGGSQAVAALAYGTKTIPPVDKIVGPGNLFVQLAKKEVLGLVDIDGFAGPSEVLVIADASADPESIALDLLSQAEHNPGCCILVTDDEGLLGRVETELAAQLETLAQCEVVARAIQRFSAAVLVADMDEACRVSNFLAPEHLQIVTAEPRKLLPQITAAGAVFLGKWTPVAVGDYLAGPSHTLPTGGTARFASGLSANDFRKRMSVIEYSAQALACDAPHITALADLERFEAHARSVNVRLKKD
ncbi:MAG: histidinol dehydrogenase [Anaerolineaceae bacterium]|nr:histidinol dehydrogenase [Anaerolineaceae bacterium]